ncbi:LysR substrate-binding domain-containing protein [Acinetobacter pittii]|uniref:LysR substrate-binding domain-containing protein n=1 Tax=Acinetobacter pittii TaxID=48296 RepID=UPI00197E7378|nr:LysR substrate-binding domain-containing protein [Acinetobacter pittii]MBN6492025.1 LysR family transcriptional regulator [Acinetobacter pittii]MDO7426480.1 LysR substrate-binding domain-containing protein [Acinetobacter baumannii]
MQKMTSRTYPSTMSLRCFEASARYLSFTKAAQVLHMTQSAISKQVAHLEESLNIQLFERSLQRLQLTPTGKLFLKETQTILNQIEISVLNILAHRNEAETLNLAAHPTLCSRWLIPTLRGFSEVHPQFHLEFQEQISSSDIDISQVDIAFLYGDGVWRDMTSIKLFEEKCIAVGSPELISKPLDKIEDFQNFVLIQSRARPRAWDDFFQAQDFLNEKTYIGPRFDTFSACVNSALINSGIALVPKFFVKKELETGELIQIWPYEMLANRSYYMIYPTSMSQTPKITAMVQWVKNRLDSE